MGRESWGVRDRRSAGGTGEKGRLGKEGERGGRLRGWTNRFEVLDRTGDIDDTDDMIGRSTPVRREREEEQVGRDNSGPGTRDGATAVVDETMMENGGREDKQADTRNRKRTVEDRSPEQRENIRVNRVRLDEFDLGKAFEEISKKMNEGARVLIERAPEGYRKELSAGLELLLGGMRDVMSGVSDKVALERTKWEAGEMDVEDKIGKLEDEVKGIKNVNSDVVKEIIKDKIRASEKDMETKVRSAMCNLKIQDFDFRAEMHDRMTMVRKVARELREDVHPDNRRQFDNIMRRTRIQILGRKTEARKLRDRTIYTVPVLLECQGRSDASELDSILKDSGYFSGFHWPQEMMGFVNEIRDEVRYQGYEERDYFVKVRPEERNGEVRIRAEVKEKKRGKVADEGDVGVPAGEQGHVGSCSGPIQTGCGGQKCTGVMLEWVSKKIISLGSRVITVQERIVILCKYKTQRIGGGIVYCIGNLMQTHAVRWWGEQRRGGGGGGKQVENLRESVREEHVRYEIISVDVERRGGEPKRDTYRAKCKRSDLCSSLQKTSNFRYHVLNAWICWCMSSGDGVVVASMESEVRTCEVVILSLMLYI